MKVVELFKSFNGEICASHQGSLAIFLRLWGCDLDCTYCDTPRGRDPIYMKEMSIHEIFDRIEEFGIPNVTITGGEPLCQEQELMALVDMLDTIGNRPSIETNGSIKIPCTYKANWVADYKLPSSGMEDMMNPKENYHQLSCNDIIKFVVGNRVDFDRAIQMMPIISDHTTATFFAFSPVWGKIKPEELAQWILDMKFDYVHNIIYSLQLHKVLNVS